MKKIRLLINTIRFSFIVGIVILVFIGERSRIMAMFGGIFLLLSVVEFILQFLCEIDERRKNGESDIYKAKGRGTLREVRGKAAKGGHRMTDEQEIARIMELRGQGLNAEQIGKKLFFSGAAIRKKVRKAGLSEQYHKMSGKSVLEMNRDDIREMIESGAKFSEIMSKYGVSKTTVAQWRKALGIPPRPLGGGNSLHLDGEELARLWYDGKSYTEIGKIVGAASQTVKNNLIRNGTIPKPCKKIRFPESQEEIAKLRKMFDGELKTVELAEKLGVGISTVSSWRRRLGIKNTGRGRRRKW